MKHKTSQVLYSYWNEVRNGRLAPRRFDIEPARIGSVLPDTFILERGDDGDYRFRLAGTRLVERFGDGVRGRSVLQGWTPRDAETIKRLIDDMTQKGCVETLLFEGRTTCGEILELEMLLLPLIHTRGAIDRILGSIGIVGKADWQGRSRIGPVRLIETEVIWPEGRPQGLPASADRQNPFFPHVRNARIVRQDRRQFRVYDGGLVKPDGKGL